MVAHIYVSVSVVFRHRVLASFSARQGIGAGSYRSQRGSYGAVDGGTVSQSNWDVNKVSQQNWDFYSMMNSSDDDLLESLAPQNWFALFIKHLEFNC